MSPVILLPAGVVALIILQNVLHKIYIKKYGIDKNYTTLMKQDVKG